MSEEDDWFERALRDLDEESDRSADDEGDETAVGDKSDETGRDDAEVDDEGGEVSEFGEADEDREGDPFGGVRDETDATESAGSDDPGDPFGGGSFGDDDASLGDDDATETPSGEAGRERSPGEDGGGEFGEGDFGGNDFDADFAEGEFGGSAPSETDEGDAGDPFGGSGANGGDDPFGGPDAGGGDDPFGEHDAGGGDPFDAGSFGDDDPFGGYRGSASGPSEDFGFGDFGGGGGDAGGETETGFDVDPDEFESAIDRTDVGIEGLDDMILGGVPSRSLLSVIGGAGTGKTTFALQFLNRALESDGKGVYITLEQTRESIFSTAEEKGWAFREAADEGRLAVVAIDPIEMANSLASIRNDLTRLIAEFDADRLVLDSVSLLEMMYDHPAKRRSEVFGFTRSLKEAGVTTLLTSEASQETPYASRHGIVEYLTDAVFVLQYVRGSDFRETRLAVEIQKIRDANHSRETKPYEITDTGISVYGRANIF
ncbi:KaiC domain-containing protein [Halorubrum sp. SD626R]|uniref:KaiC domain-containing protein n=1 Tax=Halorubrum sp. SD626R TaxID=1419722 RepID=UPI000AC78FE5|nr:KaiC domain-containing protein [Halorubrum sp. SD626R]TKX81616.1 KaiC domain-containing protein [Halorubrum sp. SD626R]